MTWVAANPFASMLLLAMALVLLRWGIMSAWDAIEIEECDHSECERPHTGDVVVEIFETGPAPWWMRWIKRVWSWLRLRRTQSAGDGVESGV